MKQLYFLIVLSFSFLGTGLAFSQSLPILSLSASNTSFSETNGTTTVIATLSAGKNKDTFIYLTPSGSASFNIDYSVATSNAKIIAGGNGYGSSDDKLAFQYGIFVDTHGNLFIADRDNHRIQKWTPGAVTGITVAGGNGPGIAANQLNYPTDIFVDTNGDLYITDEANQRIQKWASGATTGITVAGGNGQGNNANQFNNPAAVTLDSDGNIYVADRDNHRIMKFAPGSFTGLTVAGGNGAGASSNQLNLVNDVFVDSGGNIYIADQNNHRIQKWAPGATSGVTVAGVTGYNANRENSLSEPTGVYVDLSGNVYVADNNNQRIQKWAPGATSGTTIAGNEYGPGANQLGYPRSITGDSQGNIFISDTFNFRILVVPSPSQIIIPIRIPANQFTGTTTITGINDLHEELNESIILTPNTINADVSSTPPLNLTITSEDTPPKVLLSAPAQIEEEGTGGTLKVYLSALSYNPIKVNLSTSGTAIKGTDYTLNAESVTIPAGDSVATVQIIPINDSTVEQIESINIGVSSATNASPLYPSATTLLSSEDKPTVSLASNVNTISEVNGTATITATLSTATSREVTVKILPSGTATQGKDYFSSASSNVTETIAGGNGAGSNANQLNQPYGTFVDASGNIYIADRANHRIQKWTPGATSGITVAGGNGQGAAANQLNSPSGVFVTPNGDIYIADSFNSRIQKWTPGATSGITVAGGNGDGNNSIQLYNPSAVFVDNDGNMYIADQSNHRVQKWAPGGNIGVTVAGSNESGSAAYQLSGPTDVFVDHNGYVFVCDSQNNRIQKWAPGGNTPGVTVTGGNGAGSNANQLNKPNGIFVDTDGFIYIADQNNHRIQKWLLGATSGFTVAGGNGGGSNANQLNNPTRITRDSNGNILISDRSNARIQKISETLTIVIPAGQTSKTLTITGINDLEEELNESIILTPTQTINADLASSSPVTLTITSEDAPPKILLSTPLVEEEKAAVNLKVSLSTLTYNPVTVNLSTSGTAIKGTDYTLSAESVTIPAGDSVATVQIIPINDNLVEPQETIIFGVASATNASTPYPNFTTNISSEDKPNVTLSTNKTAIEEDGTATITASLSAPTSKEVIIDFLPAGTPVYDLDYSINFSTKVTQTVAGGEAGSLPNRLSNPLGVFVDKGGNIFIADQKNNRVQKWTQGATAGTSVAGAKTGSTAGSGPGELTYPSGVFVDTTGNLFIADSYNHRIQKWAPGASTGTTVAGGNGAGANPYQFNYPESVFVDINGNMYIGDKYNHRVQKWAPGALNGTTVAGGNGAGLGDSQLNLPSDVFVDSQGNIYIADQNNHRIQKWAPGALSGVTVAGGNGQGADANQFNVPSGIYVDTDGNMYIADQLNHRVQKWAPGANKGVTIAGGNDAGIGNNQLNRAARLTGDKHGRIFISDQFNNRIRRVQYQPQIVIPAGQTTGTMVINAIQDSETEPEETILVKMTGATNATVDTNPLTVSIVEGFPPAQPAPFTTSSASVCRGQNNVIYTVPAVNEATSYTWTYSGTGATFSSTTNTVSVNFSASATNGTLSVKADNLFGSSPERSLNIIVNTVPEQPSAFNESTQNVCSGQNAVVYTVPVVNSATSYTWTYSGTGTTFSSTTNSVSINFSISATDGVLSVKANNSCGSSEAIGINVSVFSSGAPENIVLNGPMVINNQVSYVASKAVTLLPSTQNPISINTGAVFLATIVSCPN